MSHGDDIYRYKGIRANFSSNIYGRPDHAALFAHLREHMHVIQHYPEPMPTALEQEIASEAGIRSDEVLVTNGATAAIELIARYMSACGYTPHIPQPTFSEYAEACKSLFKNIASEPLFKNTASEQLFKNIASEPVFTNTASEPPEAPSYAQTSAGIGHWICNPNNPTGSVVPSADLLGMADRQPTDLFVIDQSYEDYTLEPMISDREVVRRGNVLLLHSMTKRYCIPGLRLGYVVANREIINKLRPFRHTWSVNAMAIEAALFLLRTGKSVLPDIHERMAEAQRLARQLNNINGITVNRSQTTFMLCQLEEAENNDCTAAWLKERLAVDYGLLIRDASDIPPLSPYHFRIAAQSPDDNNLLIDALRRLFM